MRKNTNRQWDPIDRYDLGRFSMSSVRNSIRANVVNIGKVTNVTNVTNVTSVSNTQVASVSGGWTSGRRKRRSERRESGDRERKPKMLRYCASGGLLDSHVVSRMSRGEMCEGAVDVMRYGANGLASSAKGIAGGIGMIAEGIFGFFGSVIDAFR